MAQTKRKLVKAALDCKPVDRVPVGFWHHFLADQRHADALAHHSAWVDNLAGHDTFYKSWKPDFVKIMTDGFFLYPHEQLHDLKSIRDAENIKPLGRDSDWIQKQVELCGILTERYGKEVMVFYNLFAPTRCIEFQQTGSDAKTVITRFMKEDPEALKEVMAVLTEDIATLAKAVIADGHADGIYLSVQNIPHPDMTYEKYREFITPSEIAVLEAANSVSDYNLLHICGYMGCHNDLTWYRDYPFKAVNWAVAFEGVPLERERKSSITAALSAALTTTRKASSIPAPGKKLKKKRCTSWKKQAPEASFWAPTAPCPRTSIPKDSTGSETPLPLSA